MATHKAPIRFTYKTDDTRPAIEHTVTYPDGTPVDLTADTIDDVRIVIQHEDNALPHVHSEVDMSNAENGEVEAGLEDGDIEIEGRYFIEFLVFYDDGGRLTDPTTGYHYIDVRRSLDAEPDPGDLVPDPNISVGILEADEVRTDQLRTRDSDVIDLTDDIDADGEYSVTNLREPEVDSDAATREFVLDNAGEDNEVSNPLEEDLDADGEYSVTNLRDPEADADAATREFVLDNAGVGGDGDVSNPMTEDLDAAGHDIESVGSLDAEEIDSTNVNGVIYSDNYDTLNDAVDDATGDVTEIYVGEGTTTFDDSISWSSGRLIIKGKGIDETILRSDGESRFINEFFDRPDASLHLEGFTLDMDNVESNGRSLNINGERGDIHIESVAFQNIDLGSQGGSGGVVNINEDANRIKVVDSEFRYDTLTNRQNEKYRCVSTTGSAVKQFIARDNYHIGELVDRNDESIDFVNGYVVDVTDFALVDGCYFEEWDQYATFLRTASDHASHHISNCASYNHGSGDQFRAGASTGTEHIAITITNCSTKGTGVARSTGEKLAGDRGFVIEGSGTLGEVTVSNCTAHDTLTAISAPHAQNMKVSDCVFRNIGSLTAESRAMIVHSRHGTSSWVEFDGIQVVNDDDSTRVMDHALRFRHISANRWDSPAFVRNCTFIGYTENEAVDDNSHDVAIEIVESNNYVRDNDGNETPVY